MCGKAQPFRRSYPFGFVSARLSLAAEKNGKAVSRKAGGFPHIGRQAAKSHYVIIRKWGETVRLREA